MPMSTQPKYPDIKITVDLAGPEGNAFSILGRVQNSLKRRGAPTIEQDAFFAEATSGDYENLLAVCGKWVNFRGY